MLLSFIYALVRLQLEFVRLGTRSAAELRLELIALRHENAVLQRQFKRPRLHAVDRVIFAALGRRLSADRLPFSPATLLRWHRELVRRRWAAFRLPRRPGRPRLAHEVRELILQMAKDNPRWGYLRIKGELLKLGHNVSAAAIRRLLRRHHLGPAPRRTGLTWRQFLRAQSGAVLVCDFLTVETVLLGTLYVLVFIELRTRIVIWSACTAHPDSTWLTQQARNLTWELDEIGIQPSTLIHDRDSKFTVDFDNTLLSRGIDVILTPFRSPRSNAICERVLGTLRRECLDWLIVVGERHLTRVLSEYFEHYNRGRPHRALDLCPPRPGLGPGTGEIVRTERLHGLINEYARAA